MVDTVATVESDYIAGEGQEDYDANVSRAESASQSAQDKAVAAAGAKDEGAVGDAQAQDDYVDAVYGDGGEYDTWQDTVSGAETAYKRAQSGASETLYKNLSAHDAALEAALADTYADEMEQLALDHPSPWAARVAADARAESDKIASEQAAQETFDQAVATAQSDFQDAVANAEETKSEAQTDAHRNALTTTSEAAVAQATIQAATDQASANNGAGTQKMPDENDAGDAPDDVVIAALGEEEDGTLGNMPILNLADLLGGENSVCTTLDLGICFAAGTPVVMADGTTKPIETLRPGDLVMAVPEDDAEAPVAARMVEQVFHNPPAALIKLTIGETEIRSTAPHLFYVREKGWTAAEDLEAGDELRTPGGSWVTLDTKEEQSEPEPVFNFRVADYHTYFVGDAASGGAVLVHNEYDPYEGYWTEVGQTAKGYFRDSPVGIVSGLYTTVRHPVQTLKGIGTAIVHPIDTAKAIKDDIVQKAQTSDV